MKKVLLILFFIACLPQGALAQQNFFNIPSGAITPKKKVFYQHQLNLHPSAEMASKHHLVYGLGRDWEVGINIVNLPVRLGRHRPSPGRIAPYEAADPLGPLVMLTTQKQVRLGEKVFANGGSQAGLSLANDGPGLHWSHFTYGLLGYETEKRLRLVAGPYISDRVLMGEGNLAGVIVGFEVPVTRRFFLMGDFVSGRTKGSVSVVGGYFNVTPHFQVCLGGLIPNPGSDEEEGLVIEINLFNF
jgi:hypothetical protein